MESYNKRKKWLEEKYGKLIVLKPFKNEVYKIILMKTILEKLPRLPTKKV